MALKECAKYKLGDIAKVIDKLALRFPGTNASQNRHNWFDKTRFNLLQELKQFQNLYYVNRTDLDIATLAGMEASEAIIRGDRTVFDCHIDPSKIGIRSKRKVFEFKSPVARY